jgi:hypothetical protein
VASILFRNGISVPQFQNNPFLQNAYQLFTAVLYGLCVRPNPSETGHFGIPGSIVQLFVFRLLYGFLAILEDHSLPPKRNTFISVAIDDHKISSLVSQQKPKVASFAAAGLIDPIAKGY